ncbi:unnamed protein product [Schistosoma margrebowiei]|uniref:Uncharacterized protein n=1 Tax=Schistosoma margrebowiei TaxID=48269 RepID=A0A183LCA9_9TREM|nr:unnamed protein product [Schistosoma margrebowiei]
MVVGGSQQETLDPGFVLFGTRQKEFCEYDSNLIVELMSQLKLDHHKKPESTERPFRPSMRLLNSSHS